MLEQLNRSYFIDIMSKGQSYTLHPVLKRTKRDTNSLQLIS